MKKYILFQVGFVMIACQQPTRTRTEIPQDPDMLDSSLSELSLEKDTIEQPRVSRFPIRNFPVQDSTNFDNYQEEELLDPNSWITSYIKQRYPEAGPVKLRYQLIYSKDFRSIVVTLPMGEMELLTILVNLDPNNDVLGVLEVAYDEIAESAFRKETSFYADRIEVTEINGMTDPAETETKIYKVNQYGAFILQSDK